MHTPRYSRRTMHMNVIKSTISIYAYRTKAVTCPSNIAMMAEIRCEVTENGLQKLTEEVTCPICHEIFQDPKILPCLHYYCQLCLECVVSTCAQTEKPFNCPECREEISLKKEDVTKLPTAFFVNRMKSVHSTLQKAKGKVDDISCELCQTSSSKAQAFCRHCAMFLCDFCTQAHKRLKQYKAHAVVELDELKINAKQNLPIDTQVKLMCTDHDEQIKMYCSDCDQLICRDCTVIDHKGHKFEFVKKLAQSVRNTIEGNLKFLRKSESNLKERCAGIKLAKVIISQDIREATEFVNYSIDEVVQKLEKHRSKLLKSMEMSFQSQISKLIEEEKEIELLESEVQNLCNFIELSLTNGSNQELVSIHTKIQKQAKQKQQQCETKSQPIENALEPFSAYSISCIRTIATIAKSCELADSKQCQITGEVPKCVEIGKEINISVQAIQSNGAKCRATQYVQVQLRPLFPSNLINAKVTERRNSDYKVSFVPQAQGLHSLEVMVNGEHIRNSPFSIRVKRSLSNMKEPSHIIQGVHKLADIAISHDGKLLATQFEMGSVISVEKRGKEITTVLSGLGRPIGIATNKVGDIFISLSQQCCIQKYNKEFELLGATGCKGNTPGSLNRPGRLTMNACNEVVVCDRLNSRVQIFSENLEYERWYSIGRPLGITCNSLGQLYVTNSTQNSLYKIHDKTFGLQKIRDELSTPRGVFADYDYVFVTERGKAGISVLNHRGEFITVLGAGVLRDPGGIVGDDDGYLYVCDEVAENIFVF